MCDSLLVKTTMAIINPNRKKNNSEYRFLVNHYSNYNAKSCFINQTMQRFSNIPAHLSFITTNQEKTHKRSLARQVLKLLLGSVSLISCC